MLDPRHAAGDERMAALWRRKRELEIGLLSASGVHTRQIKAEIKRIDAEILLRQDEPWPEDLRQGRLIG